MSLALVAAKRISTSARPASPLDDAPVAAPKRSLVFAGIGAACAHLCIAAVAGLLTARPSAALQQTPAMLTQVVDIAVEKPTEKPAEKTPQPPPPLHARTAQKSANAGPPPAAAEVSQVLDADAAEEAETIVEGDSAAFAGGISETGGTSKDAVQDGNARAFGVEDGKGTSRARAAALAGGAQWDCPFPDEAGDVDSAVVGLRVSVGRDGHVTKVAIAADPGNGFGREAKRCALSKQWQPGLDDTGEPTVSESLVNVRFER